MIRGKIDKNVIRQLAELLDETNLTEIEFQDGKRKFRVARMTNAVAVAATAAPSDQAPLPAPVESATTPTDVEDYANHPGAVTSPMVGTAYMAREPGAAPFVREGDAVNKGQTIVVIEAMKTFNPIPAPAKGVVKKILVSDGNPIEFGEPIMIIE